MKKIQFPPVDVQEEAKLKRFLTTVSEFMNIDIDIREVKIIEVLVGDDTRQDVITVLSKIAASQKDKSKNGKNKPEESDLKS